MTAPLKFKKDSFVQNLAKGNLLVPFLERYDEWDHPFNFNYEPKKGDDGWHPSGDCIPSVLDLYEKAIGDYEREKISPSLQRTFLVGHFWHQVIQDALVRLDLAEETAIERKGIVGWGEGQLKVDPQTGVQIMSSPGNPWHTYEPYHYATGSGDVAPLVLPDWQGILDIKTMRSQDFDRLYKTGLLPSRFAAKYEAQINIYMDFFDQPAGMILAVNKDSSAFAEIVFERNQALIDTIYAKWEYVSECVSDGIPPAHDADEFFVLPLEGSA
jgi:hypothetical protein